MAQFVWDSKRKKTVPKSEAQNTRQEQKIGPVPDEERKPGRPKKQEEDSEKSL